MPYIIKFRRILLNKIIAELIEELGTVEEEKRDGELNYIFTQLIRYGINPNNYLRYERAIGVLECCKLELYRRLVARYEDIKRSENGDVY